VKISYDPAANAIYVQVARVQSGAAGETEVAVDGTIIDTDARGTPRGYEFLHARDRPVSLTGLPADVTAALSDFLSSGALAAAAPVERDYPGTGSPS
jgi:uncharacterized protein YuzE